MDFKKSFEEFLDRYPYDLWLTVTFGRAVGVDVARKRMKYFLKHLNKPRQVFYEKFIRLWVFFEKGLDSDNDVHIHSVISGIDSSKAALLEKECHKTFGKSMVTTGHGGVNPYLAEKYNSPALVDFDFWHINSALRG